MTDAPNVTWKLSFLLLVLLIAVPLIILVITKVIRSLSRGNYVPALAATVAIGIGLFVFVIFFNTMPVQYETGLHDTQAMRHNSLTNPVQTININQSRSTVVNSPLQFNPLFEQPVVASKPNQSEINSSASQVKQEKSPSEPLPKWVLSGLEEGNQNRQPVVQTGIFMDEDMQNPYLVSGRMVFQSGLFATREEAMENALSKATQKLQSNLESSNTQYRYSGWILSPRLVRQTAYRKIHYQTVEHDFGNLLKSGEPFKQDMYRAYLEVEDTLSVRTAILKKWRKDIGNKRTAWLGSGFGFVTFMCVFVAIYLRATHDQTTNKPTNY